MTEETTQQAEEVFKSLSVSTILVAVLATVKEVKIPMTEFFDLVSEDKELQVDYNSDNQTFTFKLKDTNGEHSDNTDATDFK